MRALARQLVQRCHHVTVVTSSAQKEQDLWQGRSVSYSELDKDLPNLRILCCGLRAIRGGRRGLLAWRKLMTLISALPGSQTAVLMRMARIIPNLSDLLDVFAQVEQPVNIVHGFNLSWEHALAAGWEYARRNKLPFVATPFAHLGVQGQDRVARNSTMDHQLHILRDAERVLTLTSVEQKGLQAYGLQAERGAVIGGGVEVWQNHFDTAVPTKSFGLDSSFALFIGRVSYEKGALHAAKAILQLNRQGRRVQLALVGQISPEFDRFYAQLTDSERQIIRPLGIVSESDKHALLDAANMLLLPSRTDSFGIALLEAWTHGKPVIGARAGGIPGVIDADENGLLVDFGDVGGLATAVQCLLEDQSLAQKLGQNGYQKAATEYTWASVAERTLAQYQELI